MSFYFNIPEKVTKAKKKEFNCEVCGLYKKVESPKMGIYGNPTTGLVFVGEAPGKEDDKEGKPFVGEQGKLLRSITRDNGINIKEHAAVINTICCKPGNKIEDTYIKSCTPILHQRITELKPKMIIALGAIPANAILGLKSREEITKLRNRFIPCYEHNCMLYVTFPPSGILKNKHWEYSFKEDLKKALTVWKRKFKSRKQVDKRLQERRILDGISIKQITSIKEFDRLIDRILKASQFAFDYETTNTKPYDDYFQVWSFAIGIGKEAWVIILNKFDNVFLLKERLTYLLTNEKIKKIIQNKKFEELVTRRFLEYDSFDPSDLTDLGNIIRNAVDPMLATHVIDQRGGCTGLDFQNLTRFGIPPYDDNIHPFMIKDKDEKQNRIHMIPDEELIQYNGLDVITTWFNWELIKDLLPMASDKFQWVYDFLYEGHEVFANMSWEGIPINLEALNDLSDLFTQRQQEIDMTIYDLPEVKAFIASKNKPTRIIRETFKLKPLKLKRKLDL